MKQPTSPQMLRRVPSRLWGGKSLRAASVASSAALVLASAAACSSSTSSTSAASSTAATSGTSSTAQASAGPIKIGIVTSLTGPYSVLGEADIQGLDIAVSQINAAGGIHGRQVQIVTEDDQTSASQATIALNSLVSQHVVAVLGGPYNQSDEAMGPIAASSSIPLVELTSQTNTVVPPKPFVYEVVPVAKYWALALMEYMKSQKVKKVAIAYNSTNPYDIEGWQAMTSAGAQYGFTVVDSETYTSTTTDFTPQLTHIQGSGADAVVLWGAGNAPDVEFAKQYRTAGIKAQLIGTAVQSSYLFTGPAGAAADGMIVDGNDADLGAGLPAGSAFTKVANGLITPFEAKYHTQPPQFAVDAYAGAQVLFAALSKASAVTGPAVNDALSNLNVLTADGAYSFSAQNHGGISNMNNIAVMQIQNGTFVATSWEKARLGQLPG
jgi:branched-chain amino acid transport system substrate-binding protein